MSLFQRRIALGALNSLLISCALLLLCTPAFSQGDTAGAVAAPPTSTAAGAIAPSSADPLTGSAVSVQAFHQLLPNDYIRIVVSAGETFSYDRTLDANGNITLPLVADGSPGSPPLHVEGLTVSGVETLLQQQYAIYYKSPNVDVALLDVGRGQVLIVTPTGRTTLRTFNNGQTLYEVLISFLDQDLRYRFAYVIRGGYDLFRNVTRQPTSIEAPALPPAESGVLDYDTGMGTREQLRLDALLARPGVQSFKVDLAQLTRGAQLEQNIELRAGDIVFLTYGEQGTTVVGRGPKLVQLVTTPQVVAGAVPVIPVATTYGLLPGETLADLLRLAGYEELPELDLRNVLIESHGADGQLKRIVANLDPASSDLDLSTVQLAHRDMVRIVPYVNQVFVVGSVRTAGAFPYNPTFKALDYLTLAGGPAGDAHLRFVKLLRPQRTVGLREEQTQMYNVDLGKDLKGQAAAGYSIVPGDVIYVPSKGYEPSIRDVTSAMSSIFLGINFFENIVGNNNNSSGS